MKKSGSKTQKGFTLIEVSLAIVIGVIVLAGAITLYNQSKVSAGNSKAADKTLAMAGLAEELAASNNGAYPTTTQFYTAWSARRDDAGSSPWGGSCSSGSYLVAFVDRLTAAAAGATQSLAGSGIYAPGTATAISYWDNMSGSAKTGIRNYMVGVVDPAGYPAAIAGGK